MAPGAKVFRVGIPDMRRNAENPIEMEVREKSVRSNVGAWYVRRLGTEAGEEAT